jgi:hypothetical protein
VLTGPVPIADRWLMSRCGLAVSGQRAGQVRQLGREQVVLVGAGEAGRGQRHPLTVRETAVLALLDTPASQHVFQAVAICRESGSGPVRAVSGNRSIYNTQSTPPGGISPDRRVRAPGPPGPSVALVVKTGPEFEAIEREQARRGNL